MSSDVQNRPLEGRNEKAIPIVVGTDGVFELHGDLVATAAAPLRDAAPAGSAVGSFKVRVVESDGTVTNAYVTLTAES